MRDTLSYKLIVPFQIICYLFIGIYGFLNKGQFSSNVLLLIIPYVIGLFVICSNIWLTHTNNHKLIDRALAQRIIVGSICVVIGGWFSDLSFMAGAIAVIGALFYTDASIPAFIAILISFATSLVLRFFAKVALINIIFSGIIGLLLLIFSFLVYNILYDGHIKMMRQNRTISQQDNIYKKELRFDKLTGVYSRAWLMQNAEEKLKSLAGRRHLSIAMIDIDNFKSVNDTFGHDAGDVVLKRLGKILSSVQSANILVGRFGGEEFTIVFDSHEDDLQIMQRLLKEFEQESFDFTDQHFSFSGGLYIITEPIALEDALKYADNALYYSKEHGRDQITLAQAR